jgi:23S rRNA pseudouridine2605 synthase/23S rRNA pseudouridine2604 synthase
MDRMRLQKWLSMSGVCSRRHGEELILAGRIRVNGEVVTVLGTTVDPTEDRIELDGTRLATPARHIYIVLHKPEGYVTSCRHAGERIVLELIDLPERLYPVGRLDKDSSGLLLLTNDGRLHHHLTHPSFEHEKEYEVRVDRPISDLALSRMARGIPLQGEKTLPAWVKRLSASRFRIVLQEGRNRQIRRMARKLGYNVIELKRTRMANIRLGDLALGAWRHLTNSEKKIMLKGLDVEERPIDQANGAKRSHSARKVTKPARG